MEEQSLLCWMPFFWQIQDIPLCPGSPPAVNLEYCLRSPPAYCLFQAEASVVVEAEASASAEDSRSFCDWKTCSEHQTVMISSNVFYQSSSWLQAYIDRADQAQAQALACRSTQKL